MPISPSILPSIHFLTNFTQLPTQSLQSDPNLNILPIQNHRSKRSSPFPKWPPSQPVSRTSHLTGSTSTFDDFDVVVGVDVCSTRSGVLQPTNQSSSAVDGQRRPLPRDTPTLPLPPPRRRSSAKVNDMLLREIRPLHVVAIAFFALFVYYVDAQALNEPGTQYIEGRLGNRRIFWCPSGYGYLAYCPQPTDWDNYSWCCTWPYLGSWKPSCCPLAIPTGAVVALIIACIILVAVLLGLSCWCCYCCPLYKQLYEYEDDDIPRGGR